MGWRMKPALATTIDERVYMPSSIEEARKNLPGKGGKVRIRYLREYTGSMINGKNGKPRTVTRQAVIMQKCAAHFTVRLEPEKQIPARGKYRLSFQYVDIITGQVKVWGVV